MIKMKVLTTLEEFEALKKGDIVCCEWKRDSYENNKRIRFNSYKVVENKKRSTEIILTRKDNIYFNYNMFLNPVEVGVSNLKEIILLFVSV